MNHSTLRTIYKHYQTEQYYSRYFQKLKKREDGRSFEQSRKISLSIDKNIVVLAQGSTILLFKLQTQIQKLLHDPLSGTFNRKLLIIQIQSGRTISNKKQSRLQHALEYWVSSRINWQEIEHQLIKTVHINNQKQQLGHVGNIIIRIINNDGCLQELALLGTQVLLWTCKLGRITDKGQIAPNSFDMLLIRSFWYPIKYCEVIQQLLIDPSLSEEMKANYTITILKNIRKDLNEDCQIISKVNGCIPEIPKQILEAIIKLWTVQIQKIPINLQQLKQAVKNCTKTVQLLIQEH